MAEMKHQIAVKSSSDKVYSALTTEAGLRAWWTTDASAEEKASGKAEFGFDKRATVFRTKIEQLKPGRKVVWSCQGDNREWKGTLLTWELSPERGMTIVRFTHGKWKKSTELFAICNSSWGELMHRLRDYAEGKNPGPHWKE